MLKSLQQRRTYKVIGDLQRPEAVAPELADKVNSLIEAAGNAPFHYACSREHQDDLSSPVPWRVYALGGDACRKLMAERVAEGDQTKIPNMLAAAQFLLQVTWLPDTGTIKGDVTAKEGEVFEGTLRNMEHIAAGSAFVQSLLLSADAAGFKTYWSSGGPLRGSAFFDRVGIPQNQLLLGSVFLFPGEPENSEVKSGSMAEKRGPVTSWSRWVEIA